MPKINNFTLQLLKPAALAKAALKFIEFVARHMFIFALLVLLSGIAMAALVTYLFTLDASSLTAAQSSALEFSTKEYQQVVQLATQKQTSYREINASKYNDLFNAAP